MRGRVRSDELTHDGNDGDARRFYDAVREGESSIKLIGIGVLDGRFAASVEELKSPPYHPKMLYMSLVEGPQYSLRSVTNRVAWWALNLFPAFRRDDLIRESIALDQLIPMHKQAVH